ncbi:MAG: hypothetical protein EXR77_10330 [Myxococcales bacterium]|nr:hypothetical protein [Myxococcales bacterium]
MIQLLSALATVSQNSDLSQDSGLASASWALTAVARAGLIDLDATIITQAVFFLTLLLLLPSMVYRPLLQRFDQREERTEGARATAKALRKQARDEVARYDDAVASQRRDALIERAETRALAQKSADELIAQARKETADHIAHGIAEQRQFAVSARQELFADASTIGAEIAAKLSGGTVADAA